MFGVFCAANGCFVFAFVKETKGRTLESMDVLFGAVDEGTRREDVEHAMQAEKEQVGVQPDEEVETHNIRLKD